MCLQYAKLSSGFSLEEGITIHSSILAGESHGQRSLAGYGPQGHKVSDTTEATKYASILGPRDRDEKLSPCSHGADAFIEIDNLGVAIIHS